MQQGGADRLYTLGNQAMIGMDGLINTVARDDRVTAIGLHIEGSEMRQPLPRQWPLPVHAASLVAVKAGASDAARR